MMGFSLQTKLIVLLAVVITAFGAGWKINGWRHDAEYKRKLEEIIRQADMQDAQNRVIISDLQKRKQEIVTKEVIRYAKIKEATDNRVCFANWDAVRLWNDALSGQESMSTDSAGATGATDGPAITDAEILENLNTNAARWEKLREQMNKIIEWDQQTFGKKD
jgi:predicted Fe-S protein YdhL (DUF1289 family)